MNRSLGWDDLRIALAIARTGSVRAAGKTLGLSHATVSRHLAGLHKQLGVTLFQRDGRRLRPTAAGIDLMESAQRIETEVNAAGRRLAGRDLDLRGVVRVALPPSLHRVLSPCIAKLRERCPEIRLEFSTSLSLANLTRREADVAVRVMSAPLDTLVGRKAARFEVAAFGHRDLVGKTPVDYATLPWVDWDEKYATYEPAVWLAANAASAVVAATADSETAMFDLVRAGVGVGYVPRVMAQSEPVLTLVDPALPSFDAPIWVLTHPDLRDTGRVRAVMTALIDGLADQLPPP